MEDLQNCKGIKSGKIDAFLWEEFTTKPYVDSGELRKIGCITTPWPCFMIAARKEVLARRFDSVRKMLTGIFESTANFENGGESSVEYIANNYGLKKEDARSWFTQVKFSNDGSISRKVLVKTIDTLHRSKVLQYDPLFSFSNLFDRYIFNFPC